jgi:dipeptidyl aminopeptidase/acylaminoacyl peptidase
VWSPDGNRVAFYSDQGGTSGVWIWEKATGMVTRFPNVIPRPFFGFETIQWLSDSRRVLVKILPADRTIAQANAMEGSSQTSASGDDPAEPSVVVRRFDPREVADTTSPEDAPQTSSAGADALRWAEVDLVILDLEMGAVTRLAERTPVRAYAMSPDEQRVAYTVAKGGEPNAQQSIYDLVVQDIDTGRRRTLATNTRLGYGIEWSWSPDSRTLAQITSGQLGSGEIVLYSVADGTRHSLRSDSLPSFDPGEGEYPPLWDASGEHLYAVGDGDLWRLNVASGQGTRLAHVSGWQIRSPVWNHGSPGIWSNDGGQTVWVVAREQNGTNAGIYAVDVATSRTRPVLEDSAAYYAVFNIAASDATHEIAFVSTGLQNPAEIRMFDTRQGRARQGSRINAALDRYALGNVRIIDWQSAEGEPLRGALLLPPGYQPGTRVPLVVYVYGGSMGSEAVNRFGLAGIGATLNMHVLATRGYAVLYPDAPLREGRTMTDHLNTVMPGVDAAIELGFADPERLAVMGQSYGSFGTLALITQTTRFKAAVITAAVLHPDLFADYLGSIGYYEQGQGNMGGSIWEHRDRYFDNSPLFLFDRIETPLMIGQGERDDNLVPSEAIFAALERLGKPVEYRLYRGEGHVITQKDNVIDFWQRRLEFLAENLDLVVDATGSVVYEGGRARRR